MKIIERVFNAETGETIDVERDETQLEKDARLADEKEANKLQAETKAKAEAKAAAQAKLAALGLTVEDLQALGL